MRQPQRLTPAAIRAELQWARRGMVAEFKHPRSFVDHLHIHLYPASITPIAKFAGTFQPSEQIDGVLLGTLAYPIPHIAFASADAADLERATCAFADLLENESRLFSQNVLAVPGSKQLIVCFELWSQFSLPFGFNTSGLLKAPDPRIQDGELIDQLAKGFADPNTYVVVRSRFVSSWRGGHGGRSQE